MQDWGFWIMAVALASGVAGVLALALRRMPGPVTEAAEADLGVYKDQLAEIDRDLARGTIGAEEAGRLRAEVGRRLLEADRTRRNGGTPAAAGRELPALALVLALVLPGGLAAYWWLGAPGYPDLPLRARLADLDAAIASRPGQAEQLERMGKRMDAAAEAKLREELAAISDPDQLRAKFRDHLLAEETGAAVRTQERLLAVLGAAASAQDHADMALALALEAEGYVSPEAEAQLRETLKRDMSNELARYLVGEMFLQGGRFDQAFRFWRPIAEDGNPDAPWVASIRERIAMVAELAGIRYSLPAGRGPTAGDMAAAAGMAPEDRQAMIEGMVAQLSDRLATEGGSVEEWNRLIRSLVVLERLDEAQTIYDEAKAKFEGRPAELSFLRQAAVESGLTP
ncbi:MULTISPECIES: c-type cytochrome biogenesis protein CcmI [Tabrizicola]|uniref:c-type cytochrome biogenesis protein CcmI n=1 Tax=Tabrizicola TaxID=1443919 RepID=UPI001081D978|nr:MULTISPECIES: c-type cytochrome biogenesis protein CcmI [Paracoccaceae]